jgi:hypothetical protein
MGQSAAIRRDGRQAEERPLGLSELRLRVGGVEIAVAGTDREDCLRQLKEATEEVDRERREAEARWLVTAAGRRALGEVA